MNKETISFKMEDYTITLCRGEEESEEIAQERLAKYANCLYNTSMKLMIKCIIFLTNSVLSFYILYKSSNILFNFETKSLLFSLSSIPSIKF